MRAVRDRLMEPDPMPASNRSSQIIVQGPQGALSVVRRIPDAAQPTAALPLVFLHADSGRASQWEPVLDLLPADRAAIAFDFRGHGRSAPARDGDYGFAGRADDLEAVVDAEGLNRVVLVAHSGGAAVALHYAARHAARVAGMLLVDPPTDPRAIPPEIRDGLVRDTAGPRGLEVQRTFYGMIAGADEAVRSRVLADVDAVHPAAMAGVAAAFAAWDPEPTLRAYDGPVFVLASSASDAQRPLYHLRPELPHRVMAGVGHWLHLERPADVVAEIASLLVRIEAERSPRAGASA